MLVNGGFFKCVSQNSLGFTLKSWRNPSNYERDQNYTMVGIFIGDDLPRIKNEFFY